MSPGVDRGRNIGIPIDSARSRSDGISTAGPGGAAGAGIAVVDGVDRGRGTRGRMLTLRADGQGAPPDPHP